MNFRDEYSQIPVISSYGIDQAIDDGTHVDISGDVGLLELLGSDPNQGIKPIHELVSMDDYLKSYGAILGKKAIHALKPLHVPNVTPLPDYSDLTLYNPDRELFPAQKDVVAASIRMLDNVGSGFIVGEMGTGKTILGMSAVHKHAQRPRNQGGSVGKYRALVLCPDHLIGKWVREIESTIPGAKVTRFGPQGGETQEKLKTKGKRKPKGEPKEETNSKKTLGHVIDLFGNSSGNRWKKPAGAEWYVMGRNQAKWLSDWIGIADEKRGFDGWFNTGMSAKTWIVDREDRLDENGRKMWDARGNKLVTNITAKVHSCPKCGSICRNKKGEILGVKDLSAETKGSTQKFCRATYLQEIDDTDKPRKNDQHGWDRICPVPDEHSQRKVDLQFIHKGRKYIVRECKEPLFGYTSRPYRWSPARIIHKKLRNFFKYLVIDEVHEHKSDESGQSMACGKLIASVKHVIALTGTIIGGYADHLFPLMMRLSPGTLKAEGFEWGKDLAFSEAYGRIDRIITTKEQDDGDFAVGGNVKSMRRAKSGSRTERKAVRPGVMPTMFGRHMIGSSLFITLDELASNLPDLFEYIGGPLGDAPRLEEFSDDKHSTANEKFDGAFERHERALAGWVDVACDMEPAQAAEYNRVAAIIEHANKDLLKRGSMKLLGAYLWTTMDYPDRPFGWGHDPELLKVHKLALAELEANPFDHRGDKLPAPKLPHTVGYWDKPHLRTVENFVGVVTPKDCPENIIYPKERALIDICLKQKADGTQTWVYVQMSGKRNIQPRLKGLLESAGLKVGILRADDVEPIDREEWIKANGRDFDVMISHPQLVSTGLDLFSNEPGGHNYSTIVFYETGYNLFTMRQAARRAWRIGQPRDCRLYYLYYKETMQHKAMQLMSRKMAAAQALEGEFSEDGLAAMAGEDNLQMALAKSMSERIDDKDMQRSWGKVKSGGGGGKARKPTEGLKLITTDEPVRAPSPLDDLPIAMQLAVEALIDAERDKMIPEEAKAEFAEVTQRIAEVFDEAEAEPVSGVEPEDSSDPFDDDAIPELTDEIMAKMFANMIANAKNAA
jgi:hypothetical protein